tara:strand:- start:10 stop:144 length:135 start_codon:yes stop_codon:yes gene_type:complete
VLFSKALQLLSQELRVGIRQSIQPINAKFKQHLPSLGTDPTDFT